MKLSWVVLSAVALRGARRVKLRLGCVIVNRGCGWREVAPLDVLYFFTVRPSSVFGRGGIAPDTRPVEKQHSVNAARGGSAARVNVCCVSLQGQRSFSSFSLLLLACRFLCQGSVGEAGRGFFWIGSRCIDCPVCVLGDRSRVCGFIRVGGCAVLRRPVVSSVS